MGKVPEAKSHSWKKKGGGAFYQETSWEQRGNNFHYQIYIISKIKSDFRSYTGSNKIEKTKENFVSEVRHGQKKNFKSI